MNAHRYTIQAPGKLFIAGEYAITAPNQPSIVAAIDRYLSVDIQSSRLNRIDLPQLGLTDIHWRFDDDKFKLSVHDDRLHFFASVMKTIYQYKGADTPAHIFVTSDLDHDDGKKYGLGSSAAFVVALTEALLQCGDKQAVDKLTIFKLASIAHFKAQGNGSCADIAASVYGGLVYYRSFDFDFLTDALSTNVPVKELVQMDWPHLQIERLTVPTSLYFMVGWTKEEAQTKPFIERFQQLKETDRTSYQAFLTETDTIVETLRESFKDNNQTGVLAGIRANRQLLRALQEKIDVPIETETLTALIDSAKTGAFKTSGAGGGDCGIGFVSDKATFKQVKAAWLEHGIEYLDLNVSPFGVTVN